MEGDIYEDINIPIIETVSLEHDDEGLVFKAYLPSNGIVHFAIKLTDDNNQMECYVSLTEEQTVKLAKLLHKSIKFEG